MGAVGQAVRIRWLGTFRESDRAGEGRMSTCPTPHAPSTHVPVGSSLSLQPAIWLSGIAAETPLFPLMR